MLVQHNYPAPTDPEASNGEEEAVLDDHDSDTSDESIILGSAPQLMAATQEENFESFNTTAVYTGFGLEGGMVEMVGRAGMEGMVQVGSPRLRTLYLCSYMGPPTVVPPSDMMVSAEAKWL